MAKLTLGQVGDLRKAVAEATRTDESTASDVATRFVELSRGLQAQLKAKRHHLLTGRRGTGKSTHLYVVRNELAESGTAAPLIDMEVFKGREYPDVLLEILVALLTAIRPRIRFRTFLSDVQQRARVRRLILDLSQLLNDPQSMTTTVRDVVTGASTARVGASATVQAQVVTIDGGYSQEANRAHSVARDAQFEARKIDRMRQLAGRVSVVLKALVAHSGDKFALVFLDDFYYVRLSDQPYVLDFLQQACKNTGVYLKVGGVGSRLRPFIDGDPPVGMQPTQDISNLPIDVTLSDFASAKLFLEAVLNGVLSPLGATVEELFTDTARERMVLACGGAVARDYLTLTESAVHESVERLTKSAEQNVSEGSVIRVHSSDVHRAAGKRISAKESDSIRQDAGEDAVVLNSRWRDVCEFAKETGDTAFVLVEQSRLESESWGNEILQLEHLRLLHRIGEAVPKTPSWRGRRVVIYLIDLGQIVAQRLTEEIIPFWESQAEFEKLRRAQWVYDPDWRKRPKLPLAKLPRTDQDELDPTLPEADPNALFDSLDMLGDEDLGRVG